MTTHPNVLFLSVDALRADRVSFLGYQRPTTPNLDALAKQALICEKAVSTAAFTQASFHSFMTSSRPLSHGGYDMGNRGRPPTIFKALHDAGYETISVSTFPWVTRYFGYGDGSVDTEIHLFILNTLVGIHGGGTIASTLRAWHGEEISVEDAAKDTKPMIVKMFDDIETYCKGRQLNNDIDRLDFWDSLFMNEGWNFARVLNVVARHRTEFLRDECAYMKAHLYYVPQAHEWLARDWRYCRTPEKLIKEGFFRLSNRLLALADPKHAALRANGLKKYVDGAALADRVIREIGSRKHTDRPFFLWTHFVDTHVPYCGGRGRQWYKQTPGYLSRLGYSADLDISVAVQGKPKTDLEWETWSALYDAAILYVDEQIGRIVLALEEMGIAEDTMIVVCGDHGEELGEHGDISHHFRLYNHNIRVPMLFHQPGMAAQRIEAPTSLLDLAPTIAKLAGIEPPSNWQGSPVHDPSVAQRRHVVLETFHGGNCLFDRRPLYMAVCTPKWKYLWKEYLDPTDRFSPEGPELYDLEADPLEKVNLYRPDHPLVDGFNRLIARRMSEISEIDESRIDAAFGPDWRTTEAAQ